MNEGKDLQGIMHLCVEILVLTFLALAETS